MGIKISGSNEKEIPRRTCIYTELLTEKAFHTNGAELLKISIVKKH